MTKIRKISAMALAVLMMMAVLTGCGGGASGKDLFIQNTNAARRAHGYSAVEEDRVLNDCAEVSMETLKTCASTGSSATAKYLWDTYVDSVVGTTGTMSHGYGKITYVDVFKASPSDYASGNYTLSDSKISRVNGNCIGIYTENIEGQVYIMVVMAVV